MIFFTNARICSVVTFNLKRLYRLYIKRYPITSRLDKIDIIHISLNSLSIITLSLEHFHTSKKDIPLPVKSTVPECPFSHTLLYF